MTIATCWVFGWAYRGVGANRAFRTRMLFWRSWGRTEPRARRSPSLLCVFFLGYFYTGSGEWENGTCELGSGNGELGVYSCDSRGNNCSALYRNTSRMFGLHGAQPPLRHLEHGIVWISHSRPQGRRRDGTSNFTQCAVGGTGWSDEPIMPHAWGRHTPPHVKEKGPESKVRPNSDGRKSTFSGSSFFVIASPEYPVLLSCSVSDPRGGKGR